MQHLLHFTLWLLCSYCDRPIQKKVKRPNPWEAPQLEKKRKEKLAVNFVKSRDTMQIPIDRKMLNEPGTEHQLRPKRDIEKGCASTRSMFLCPLDVSRSIHVRLLDFLSRRRTCPKTIRLERDIRLRHPRNSKSLFVGPLSLRRADLLLMDDRPCTQFSPGPRVYPGFLPWTWRFLPMIGRTSTKLTLLSWMNAFLTNSVD